MAAFRTKYKPLTEQIVVARRVSSGNIILLIANIEVREALEKLSKQLNKGAYQIAIILRKLYSVAINNVPLRYYYNKDITITKQRVELNIKRLYSGLKLINIKVPLVNTRLDKYGKKKKYSTIIFNIAILQMAVDIIIKGFIKVITYRLVRT